MNFNQLKRLADKCVFSAEGVTIMKTEEYNYRLQQINQLTNNWNELEKLVKEYINKNDNWYNNELSTHDKQYYGDSYCTTNYMLEKFLDKMNEIKGDKNE